MIVRSWLALTFGLLGTLTAGPITIAQRTGANNGTLLYPAEGVSWTQTTSYSNVSISVNLADFCCTTPSWSAAFYLTDSIGPGTTQSVNEIATASFSGSGDPPSSLTVLSGLSLSSGTYYLTLVGSGTDIVISNTSTTTVAPGVTINLDYRMLSIGPYAPASALDSSYTDGIHFNFQVTGVQTPEPATILTSGASLILGIFVTASRRRRRKT